MGWGLQLIGKMEALAFYGRDLGVKIPGSLVLASLGGTALYGLAAPGQDFEVETLFSCPLPCTKDLFWDY